MPKGKHGNHRRGSSHYRWNDKKILSSHGYVKIRVGRIHPLADLNGYAYEHLIVWVAAGMTAPGPCSVLHHRNENKTDNRIENLEVLTRKEHSDTHAQQKWPREQGECKTHGVTEFAIRRTKEGWRNARCLECKRTRRRKTRPVRGTTTSRTKPSRMENLPK